MKQLLNPGKYVIAVSGGVDSVVLLNMLIVNKLSNTELVVAHFDHGIRQDSARDRQFVETLAHSYGLPFEYAEGNLGLATNEDTARQARYAFLKDIKRKTNATVIVTAHHEDDVLETMVLNLMRGTGRKGLSSLASTDDVMRPLLHYKKSELVNYAKDHGLAWQEDRTNNDERILRNWVRKNVISKLSEDQRLRLLDIHQQSKGTNAQLDTLLQELHSSEDSLDKRLLLQLSHNAALELLAHWLREHGVRSFTKKQLEMVLIGAKTLARGKTADIYGKNKVRYTKDSVRLIKV